MEHKPPAMGDFAATGLRGSKNGSSGMTAVYRRMEVVWKVPRDQYWSRKPVALTEQYPSLYDPIAQLRDGMIAVSLTAAIVDEEEPQLLNQEIVSERVASIEDALALITSSVVAYWAGVRVPLPSKIGEDAREGTVVRHQRKVIVAQLLSGAARVPSARHQFIEAYGSFGSFGS